MGIIFGSVLLILLAFGLSLVLASVERFLVSNLPGADEIASLFTLFRFAPAFILFGSLYLLFYTLTPKHYRSKQCYKWPGPAFVTVWWLGTTAALPLMLSSLGGYDLTYGSLAGVILALLFFYLIGFGVTVGAQLNAALAETPEPTVKDVEEVKAEEAAEQAAEAAKAEKITEEDA
jgi:membrane protein